MQQLRRGFATGGRRVGVAFDIDGVLIRGNHVLPQAIKAIELIHEHNIPHIFLTNGGGRLESDKAEQLEDWLGFPVDPEQVILSHTPMKGLVEKYGSKPVLIGGPPRVLSVAQAYGYKKAVHIEQVVKGDPHVWPCGDHQFDEPEGEIIPMNDIEAVLFMHDDDNWGRDIQVITDALIAGVEERGSQTPLYFSNPDFVYAANHPLPRLAQGLFRKAMEAVYLGLTGSAMEATAFGKPNAPTYAYAQDAIERNAGGPVDIVYGIGDNPHSDIAGANAKEGWRSVLLRTGVWDGQSEPEHAPDHIADDVLEAVSAIVEGDYDHWRIIS